MLRQKRTIARLRKKVSDQDKLSEDLRRENNAFIKDDEDFLEEMDYEEVDEDEEMIDEEESHEALVDDEEEDPEEPEYVSDTNNIEPQIPPQ